MSHIVLGCDLSGWAFHRPGEAFALLHAMGFGHVIVPAAHPWLDALSEDLSKARELGRELAQIGLLVTLDAAVPFAVDSADRWRPGWLHPDPDQRQRRQRWFQQAARCGRALGADLILTASGPCVDEEDEHALEVLAGELELACRWADNLGLRVALTPAPGQYIDDTAGFLRLRQWLPSSRLQVAMHLGNMYRRGEAPLSRYLESVADHLALVGCADAAASDHRLVICGEGDLRFQPVVETLVRIGFAGPLVVRQPWTSDNAVEASRRAFDVLQQACWDAEREGKR